MPAIRALRRVMAALALLAGRVVAQEAPADSQPGWKLYPVPVISYSPETRLMLGAAVVGVRAPRDPATRPTSLLGAAVYTLRRQFSVSFGIDSWSRGNAWHLTGEVAFSRFPADYYGSGATTADTAETYTPETIGITFSAQRRVARSLYAGPNYSFRRVLMVETAPGGLLEPGTVPGSRGGRAALLGFDVVADTRPSLYGPRGGVFVRLHCGFATEAFGSEFEAVRYGMDARLYTTLGSRVVLAAQGVTTVVDGIPPFDLLPQLGGQAILRGYEEPRFRDKAMGAVQAELRVPVGGRLGAVVFAGAGTVASSPGSLPDGVIRPAGGAGVRFVLDQASGLMLRIDYAVARGGGGLYLGGGDAF